MSDKFSGDKEGDGERQKVFVDDPDLFSILDVPALQSLMDDFFAVTGIANALIDLKGKVLVGAGWQDICTKFHRVNPQTQKNCVESDLVLTKGVKHGEFRAYKCKNNLWDIVTPLCIGEKHVANIFSGQFFFDDDKVDQADFAAQAEKYGFHKDAYLEALDRVPRLNRQKVENLMSYLTRLTEMISKLSLSNLELAKFLSEQKSIQNALRESEKRLRKAQEMAHLGSWELDLTNNRLSWSDEVYRIFGLQPKEFSATYEAFLDAVHPDDRATVNAAYSGSLREGKDTYEIEHRVVRKSTGEIRVVYEKCEHIRDASGKVVRSVGMVHDITEQKKVEQELWRAKNDWERTFKSVPDFIAIIDNQHKILRVNHAMAHQLGVTPEQAVGLSCYQCVHGSNSPPDFCPHSKSVKEGKECIAEVHEPRLGGDFLVSTTPLRNEKGTVIGSVHVARNITERKKAEDALNKLNRHLRAISSSNQALMHAVDEEGFSQDVCNIIIHDCGYALVWVGFAEHDKGKTVRPIAYAGFDKKYIDQLNVTWADEPRGRGPTGTVIRTGKPYVCRNMQVDPNFIPWREQAAKRGYTSSLVLPLSSFKDKTFGALNIYSREPTAFSDEELKLLTELANDFASGIEMLRLRREREQAVESLRKQAELIDLSPDAIIVRKLDGTITFWSKGAEKLYGWSQRGSSGKTNSFIAKYEASRIL